VSIRTVYIADADGGNEHVEMMMLVVGATSPGHFLGLSAAPARLSVRYPLGYAARSPFSTRAPEIFSRWTYKIRDEERTT
jgi:hypothetical protein